MTCVSRIFMAVKANEAQLHCINNFSNYELRAEISSVEYKGLKPAINVNNVKDNFNY